MKYEIEVKVRDKEKVWRIGDRFYKVSPKSLVTYRETCPICDGSKKVEIRGREFPCPYCQDRSNSYCIKDLQSVTLHGFNVVEYIVNGFEVSCEEKKGNYQPKGTTKEPPKFKRLDAFTKWGNSYNAVSTTRAPHFDELDLTTEQALKCLSLEYVAFTTVKKAEAFVAALVEREKARLAEFNEKFGCNYEYQEDKD